MAATTAPAAAPGFPEALETCLREDACVRADAAQLALKLEEVRAAAAQAREGTARPGRLLAALGWKKDPSTSAEAAAITARENVLQRQIRESERLQQHYAGMLDAQLAAYLEAAVPAYLQQSRARVRLAEWERIIGDLRVDLRELLKMLGQARNNAVAGYDRTTQLMSATARAMFAQCNSLIGSVETRVRQANAKAAELGGLPGVTIIPLRETITNLTKLEIATMLREFDRVVRELELFEQKQLVDLQAPAVAAADAQVAQAQAYLAQYREQLRAHYGSQVTPAQVAEAIPLILERFRTG